MDSAGPADPRSLWFNSSDALLQVLCLVAMNGHDASNFSSLTRAFRWDVVCCGAASGTGVGQEGGMHSWPAQGEETLPVCAGCWTGVLM
jgi:hypothetical protein